jgi:hypothetical protein
MNNHTAADQGSWNVWEKLGKKENNYLGAGKMQKEKSSLLIWYHLFSLNRYGHWRLRLGGISFTGHCFFYPRLLSLGP